MASKHGFRVGIFGGTFDPIHLGHLIIAEQVMETLGLERVIFVPSGIPPHKEAASVVAPAEGRLRMVEAAVSGNERFLVDPLEVDAGRAMYSVETVPLIKERHEGGEWYFVGGADEVANLLSWREPDRLLEEAYMVAATRPGYDLSNLKHLSDELKNFEKIVPVECSRVDISATDIRRRLAKGRTARYLVPDAVREIVEEERFYAGEDGSRRVEEERLSRKGAL